APQIVPSFVQSTKQVKSPRYSVQHDGTFISAKPASPKPTSPGKRKNRKACFVCKSVDHLIKDCDYHAKKMAQPTPRNHAHRHLTCSPSPKARNSPTKVTAIKAPVVSVAQGNMSYLSYFEEINGGYVAFGGNPKGDDYSRFTWVFFLATKDETSPILKTFITGLENQLSLKVKVIRSDNGTEFKNNDLNQFCRMKGIKREFSVPRTPQQNGIAERKNMTLIEAAKTMLPDSLKSDAGPLNATASSIYGKSSFMDASQLPNDPDMLELEDITHSADEDDVGAEADFNNLETSITVSPILTTRVHKDHPVSQIIVKQKKDGIFISQDKYVTKILRKFGLTKGKSASTPIDTEKPLLKDLNGEDVDVHTYISMIGSLMYLTSSRPDIMFAVCACAHFQVTPKALHLHAVKRLFRYLKGKPHLGLWYPKDSPFDLVAYSDSDYAGASLDRKSTTEGCQFFGCRLISWQCKKQTVVATSSTKAEYVAAASCCAQVLWIQNQLWVMGIILCIL
nr:hypothetical protein [Tanacetum cinerariifolium]